MVSLHGPAMRSPAFLGLFYYQLRGKCRPHGMGARLRWIGRRRWMGFGCIGVVR